MGGRGGISGISTEGKHEQSKKWDYRGFVETVDKIEEAATAANNHQKAASVYSAIQVQEKIVTEELERIKNGSDDTGDYKVLLTQRRRLRQLRKKLIGRSIV